MINLCSRRQSNQAEGTVKILTWNVQQGGGSRVDKILETIEAFDSDSIILTEFRDNHKGARISSVLSEKGFEYQLAAPSSGENSVFLASKQVFEPINFAVKLGQNTHRCVAAKFASHNLFGFYFPQKYEKYDLFQFIIKNLKLFLNEPSLLIGDFNTGKHYLDEIRGTFKCAELFESMERQGWVDLWRHVNGRKRDYSWFSRAGNGFRIDHAFGSSSFLQNLISAEYYHEPRELRISDHSPLCLEWENGESMD
jgi:exonuclease III